jgi:hypothetical protein
VAKCGDRGTKKVNKHRGKRAGIHTKWEERYRQDTVREGKNREQHEGRIAKKDLA